MAQDGESNSRVKRALDEFIRHWQAGLQSIIFSGYFCSSADPAERYRSMNRDCKRGDAFLEEIYREVYGQSKVPVPAVGRRIDGGNHEPTSGKPVESSGSQTLPIGRGNQAPGSQW